MTSRPIVILSPSEGKGGGIERYIESIQWAFQSRGLAFQRIDLHGTGPAAHLRARKACVDVMRGAGARRLVVAHRCLLPVALEVSRMDRKCEISLICHGAEVWGSKKDLRKLIENQLMRHPKVRVIAVSGFTSGVVSDRRRAAVLPPGLAKDWFERLVTAAEAARATPELRIVTSFRLADWRRKGLPELLRAISALGRSDVSLNICGSGEPPAEMLSLVRRHQHCTVLPNLTDAELARQLAEADLFVLATRTSRGRQPSGEGFGLVLLEAQLAGTAVVGPAFGGSRDAYFEGLTGATPVDESAEALSRTLADLLSEPARLAAMGKRAAGWARENFAPDIYAERAIGTLL